MPPSWVEARVDAEEWEPLGGGYTRAAKWIARLRDGTKVFVKSAEERELLVYQHVRGPFLPTVYDLHTEADRVLLVLEDLSDAHWPPPYPDDLSPLFAGLDAVAASPTPPLRPLEEPAFRPWARFQRDPEPLLSLGVCSEKWLTTALPALADAEGEIPVVGAQLVHNDIWADNLCFADRGTVFVDWSEARVGNAEIDVAFALLTLQVGGVATPPVENAPALAAFVTGIVAFEASSPLPAWTTEDSTLRQDQLADLRVALPWTAELLGLPPPGTS
jgi:phosphotransferase family enzyme